MNDLDIFSDVVGSIYETAYRPQQWKVALGKDMGAFAAQFLAFIL